MTKKVMDMTLNEIFAEAYIQLDRNEIPTQQIFQLMIDNVHWKQNNKENDAVTKAMEVRAMVEETTATESEVSGKVVMQHGSSPVGAMHYNEWDVDRKIQYAERDEQEAQAHLKFYELLTKAYKEHTGDRYLTKEERKGTAYKSKTNVSHWLAKKLPQAAQ